MPRFLSWTLGLLAALVVAVLLFLMFPPTSWIAGKVEQLVAERTGYTLDIGELDLELLSNTPSATVKAVSLDGERQTGLLESGRAAISVDLSAALNGELVLDSVVIEDAYVQLLRTADGLTSWTPATLDTIEAAAEDVADEAVEPDGGEFVLPTIRTLHVEDLRMRWDDEMTGTDARLDIQARGSTLPGETPLLVEAQGIGNSAPLQASVLLESPLEQVLTGEPKQIALNVSTDGATIGVAGRIGELATLDATDLVLDLDVDSLAALEIALGLELPAIAPATLVATFRTSGKDVFATADGTLAEEPVSAALALELASPVTALMSSDGPVVLDLDARIGGATLDLAGHVGTLATLADVELALVADVASLAALEIVLDRELPALAPASLLVTLRSEGDGYVVRAEGRVDGERIEASLDLDNSLEDMRAGAPVELDLDVSVGGASVSASGHVENLRTLDGADLDLDVGIDSLVALAKMTGLELPDIAPASLSTMVRSVDGNTVLEAEGEIDGAPVSATLALESSIEGVLSGEALQLDLDASVGGASIRIDGRIGDPATFGDLDLSLDVDIDSLAAIEMVLGTQLPALSPATFGATVRTDGREYVVRRFDLEAANSLIEGDVRVDPSTGPLSVYANLVALRLDVDAMLDAFGVDSDEGARGDAGVIDDESPEEGGPVLSSDALPIDRLFGPAQGAVALRVDELLYDAAPLGSLGARATFSPDRITLEIDETELSGGDIKTTLELKPIDDRTSLDGKLDMQISRLRIAPFLPDIEQLDDAGGPLGGRVELWVSGDSVASLAASLDGGVLLLMGSGRLDEALVELAGIDLFQATGDLLNPVEDEFRIRCAYASLHAESGVVSVDDLVIDSSDTVFLAEGTIDLGEETLEVRLEPHPKDPSLLAASTTATVSGTFADLQFGVDEGLASRAAAAAVLAIVATPAAALLPFIEIGTGEDSGFCKLEGALDGDAG